MPGRVTKDKIPNSPLFILIVALILSIDTQIPSNIVIIYSLRMQIEQNLRDLKNNHHGFGLEDSGTKDLMRLSNLLLIANVALVIALLIGLAGEQNKIHLKYQANTFKNRRVLSLIYLCIRIWQTDVSQVISYIKQAITQLSFVHLGNIQND